MQWRVWLCRVIPYLGRRRAEEDLQEELRLHLELERERQRDAGLSESDALRAGRRKLGNRMLIRERTRDVWGWRWLDDLWRDVRHGIRGLRKSPGFAASVVLVIALGIGANTAMFGVVYGMLIRPLPYPEADAIVRVGQVNSTRPNDPALVSNMTFPRLQEEVESFEQIAAYVPRSLVWLGPDGPRTLRSATVSPSLFPLLRAAPQLGRLFVEADAREGGARVALLSHGAWTSRYASDPDIVGASLDVDGEAFTVVGVLSEGFSFPSAEEEIWTPLVIPPFEPGAIGLSFPALGRLRPGVSPEQAAAEARTVLNADRSPSDPRPLLEAHVIPLQEEMVSAYRPALVLLSAVTALVLAIACINVAGLFLAHGVARRRELAVRGALGAGRGRIMRQLLTESVALGVGGGALGLAAAALILRGAPALAPGAVPRLDEVGVDGVVLAFGAGLSVVAGLVFGAVPALSWSRLHLLRALGEGLRLRGGRAFTRLDESGSPRVAIVNETLERELFDGESAVGRRVRLPAVGGDLQAGSGDELWAVVGVVADVEHEGPAAAGSSAAVYIPMRQSEASPFPFMNTPFISVRTNGNPLAVVPFLREAVAEVHPRAALDDVTTMEARLSSSVAQPRFQAVFVAGFGAVALLLAMLGVYGLLSYTVAQRRGEIGIRMALGAQTGHVLALVVRQGALLIAAGVGLGLLAAGASSRVLESFLFGVAPGDRFTSSRRRWC